MFNKINTIPIRILSNFFIVINTPRKIVMVRSRRNIAGLTHSRPQYHKAPQKTIRSAAKKSELSHTAHELRVAQPLWKTNT